MNDETPNHAGRGGPARPETGRFGTAELFGPNTEIIIEHNGEDYRLRITSNGKLILTK